MKLALFKPFDLNKWMRVGFTAWLAGLLDGTRGGGGNANESHHADWDAFFRFPETAWDWLISHPLWFSLIVTGILLLIILVTLLIWLGSRGKFMFLHNVAQNAMEISHPWHAYRSEGNSLFLWRFFFGWGFFICLLLYALFVFGTAKGLYYGHFPTVVVFWNIVLMVAVLLVMLVVGGFISLFLTDFVVPLQYRHRLGILAAWKKFLRLFKGHILSFLVYGVFIVLLWVAAVIAVLMAGMLTCCIGLLLLAIPYIGAVLFLPVSYTFRALSLEFLAQFGDEYNVFPLPASAAPLPADSAGS